MAVKTFNLDSGLARGAMIAGACVAVVMALVAAMWFFGSTLAARSVYKEISEVAVELSPDDPQTHFINAYLHEKTFRPEDLPVSLAEFGRAAALSPHDFRYWLELGQAYSRAGDSDRAGQALRRALELAPNYSRVQWSYGNFLLRDGKSDEAFAAIRRAAEGDRAYAASAVTSAWQLFGGDAAQIRGYVGDSPNLKAAFALVLAREKRFDDAAAVWNDVPAEQRRTDFKTEGEEIYRRMTEARRFRAALGVYATVAPDDAPKFAVGSFTNGGIELPYPKLPSVFEWQIADGVEPQIGVDNTQRHGGEFSLKIIFKSTDGLAFRPVSQTIAVEPGRKYSFQTFYRSELKSTTATLKWEIADAADPKVVYASTPAIATEADWTPLAAEFTVPTTAEAVIVRLVRDTCTERGKACPITGRIWFDDFTIN